MSEEIQVPMTVKIRQQIAELEKSTGLQPAILFVTSKSFSELIEECRLIQTDFNPLAVCVIFSGSLIVPEEYIRDFTDFSMDDSEADEDVRVSFGKYLETKRGFLCRY